MALICSVLEEESDQTNCLNPKKMIDLSDNIGPEKFTSAQKSNEPFVVRVVREIFHLIF